MIDSEDVHYLRLQRIEDEYRLHPEAGCRGSVIEAFGLDWLQ